MLNNKGFTLLELLVALALLVILSGALYGTYFSVTAAREKGGVRMEERRELSSTLGRVHGEIASAFFNTNNIKNNRLLFKVEDRDSFGKPTSLIAFTSLGAPRLDPVPSSELTLVSYFVKEEEGKLTLVRESRDPYLDTTRVKSYPYPVIDAIESFQVECYDGGKWVKSWDSAPTLNGHLPKAVRITVTTKGGEAFTTIASPMSGTTL